MFPAVVFFPLQVRGFCKDKSNPEIFDQVNVYGNIYDSELHHMNFAVYTYGHQQGDWRRNIVHSNSGYGKPPIPPPPILNFYRHCFQPTFKFSHPVSLTFEPRPPLGTILAYLPGVTQVEKYEACRSYRGGGVSLLVSNWFSTVSSLTP